MPALAAFLALALLAAPLTAETQHVGGLPVQRIGLSSQGETASTESASPELVVVPDITKRSLEEARRLLEAVGLVLKAREPVMDNAHAIVVRQRPPAGARVRPGTPVRVVISRTELSKRRPAPPAPARERPEASPAPKVRPEAPPDPDAIRQPGRPTIPGPGPSPPAVTPPSPPVHGETAERDRPTRAAERLRGTAGGGGGVDQDLLAVDRILNSLELGNVAFNTPATLWVRETAIIELLLSMRHTIEELQKEITAPGEKGGARVRISNQMEARLSGPGFKIEAITPEVQAVSASEPTQWKWEIEPTKSGSHHIHLTLSAHLQVEGQRVPRLIRTFERSIRVNVTWRERAGLFLAGNWQWFWTAILVPVVPWLLHRWKRVGKKQRR
jgi:hypothetical protein